MSDFYVFNFISSLLVLSIFQSEGAYVKRDVESTTHNILQSFQVNADVVRKCIDESVAKSISDVSTNQLQPVFSVIGEQLNRFSKAVSTGTVYNRLEVHCTYEHTSIRNNSPCKRIGRLWKLFLYTYDSELLSISSD